MEGLRFIKSMESLINRQTLSPGFYGRISTAYLVESIEQPCPYFHNVYILFPNFFVLGEKLVWHKAQVVCKRILQKNVFRDLWTGVSGEEVL